MHTRETTDVCAATWVLILGNQHVMITVNVYLFLLYAKCSIYGINASIREIVIICVVYVTGQ